MSNSDARTGEAKARQSAGTHDAKPSRLGRGLSSLMGLRAPVEVDGSGRGASTTFDHAVPSHNSGLASENVVVVESPESPSGPSSPSRDDAGGRALALSSIVANRFQPRRAIDEAQLGALAASIRSSGVMQPVIVRPIGGGGAARYELVAGERRWRAAGIAGLAEIPAIVRELSDAQAAEWALVENVQREDLNAMDRARALKSLVERFGSTQSDLGARIGMDRSTIANLIRLTELEPEIAELIGKNRLSAGHGKALLGAPAGAARVRLARQAADHGYSVRRVEMEAKRLGSAGPGPAASKGKFPSPRQAVLADIEKRISQALGTRVAIRTDPTGKRGQISIEFFDLDQFDGLLSRLGVAPM